MMREEISHSVKETEEIARKFAKTVKPGDIVCLFGNLGSGKTHFTRGFVQAFGIASEEVDSPTFTIINEYEGDVSVYHVDCYRLEHHSEALEIGVEDYLYGDGICIIEWPERILELLPEDILRVEIEDLGETSRKITFKHSV